MANKLVPRRRLVRKPAPAEEVVAAVEHLLR